MVIGAMTVHPFAIGSGTLELLYDASLADGPPVVSLDLRYGATVVDSIAHPAPGQLIVTFHSDGGLYNAALHGAIVVRRLSRAEHTTSACSGDLRCRYSDLRCDLENLRIHLEVVANRPCRGVCDAVDVERKLYARDVPGLIQRACVRRIGVICRVCVYLYDS